MTEFHRLLQEGYQTRNSALIPAILALVKEDCVVIGTSLGEFGVGKMAVQDLLMNDFRYWVDIDIDPSFTQETFGDYHLYHTSAKAHYRFRENEQTYQRYLTYVEAIIQDPQANVYKALKIINMLNHLLASKPKKIRHYQRTLAIDYVMKDNQVVLLSYAFSFDYPHVDGVEGLEEEMDKAYTKDVQTLQVDSEFSFVMRNNITLYDQAWKELYLQRNGNLFFGCGKLTHSFPLDRAILEDFKVLKNSDSSYQKLYRIRKTLTETLKMYSHVATPNLMVRLYGIVADQQVLFVKHHFPFYWILED